MGPKEFVIAKMKQLVQEFSFVKTSYSFHELSDTHSVEVIPNDLYHNNEDFKNWEGDFVYDFMNLFPNDSICVLTDDSIIPIENIEFSFEGETFNCNIDCLSKPEVNFQILENKIYVPGSIFETHIPLIEDEFSFNQLLIDINTLPTIFNQNFKMSSSSSVKSSLLIKSKSNSIAEELNDENNYSFAA